MLVCVPTTVSAVTAMSSPVGPMARADAHTVDVDEVHTDVAQDASPTSTVGVLSLV